MKIRFLHELRPEKKGCSYERIQKVRTGFSPPEPYCNTTVKSVLYLTDIHFLLQK